MKKAKLWAHSTYEMVEHNEFSKKRNSPAYVRAENYDFLVRRCENLEAENARLKAEVERLKAEPDALTAYLYADTLRRDDIKTLKAQVKRLTKAGDAMAIALNLNDDVFDNHEKKLAQSAWYAAKEGKQP
ncbi:MAG: hypothetical protein EBW87_03720 [Burkholderiaceae bacterium]|nr:hypothetical protein [Burkholderiaceae bacterium]